MAHSPIEYEYHENVYVLDGLIDWFNAHVPPDDIQLLFDEILDVLREQATAQAVQDLFATHTQVLMKYPYRLRTIGTSTELIVICRFVKVTESQSQSFRVLGYISFGIKDEMEAFLKKSQKPIKHHSLIELPRPQKQAH